MDTIYSRVISSTYQKEAGKSYRERSQEMVLNQEGATVRNWGFKGHSSVASWICKQSLGISMSAPVSHCLKTRRINTRILLACKVQVGLKNLEAEMR